MKIFKRLISSPAYWAVIIFIVAQLLTFLVIFQVDPFIESSHIYIPPQSPESISLWPQPVPSAPPGEVPAPAVGSIGPILIYFFVLVIVLGIILSLVPVSTLRLLLRILFALLFSWGTFIIFIFWLPAIAALLIAIAVGSSWFFIPRIWLHNAVMVLALVSLAAVFGRLISPWTSMILILALAVYDFIAVRFGYMLWMAKKLSESSTLPAFIIPRFVSEWNSSLKQSDFNKLAEEKSFETKYSILGGGDVGFPLLLASSTYFGYGLTDAIIVALFSMLGLVSAYGIQATILKGKPIPALPPIAVLSLIALFVVRYF